MFTRFWVSQLVVLARADREGRERVLGLKKTSFLQNRERRYFFDLGSVRGGLEERKLLQLRHSYLQGQPFADMLLPGSSLFDLSQAVFPGGRILLNEHFRCAEPIIQFSLQFYPEGIVPLRIPKQSERLDPPLIDVYVSNGCRDNNKINRAEAKAIVDEVENLVSDSSFENRSIGIVSLLGSKQAHLIQNLLIERIGEDAFLKHRIACGDSATFQGKERDIVFLSMVASPGKAQAQASRLFEQRFNVAMSRAKDRMYLFRSVRTEDLPNPRDLKLRVINHFRTPMPNGLQTFDELSSLCESDFEREVFTRLLKLGYRVIPQLSVGNYFIDLVIEGEDDRRLAVELDGDRFHGPDRWLDDYRRQKALERVGWQFWRCWASSFALDPDECMSELIELLRQMKIEPIGQIDAKRVLTEHRVVNTDEESEPENGIQNEEVTVEKAETGDKLLLEFDSEPNRQYLFTLSEGHEDLQNGVVSTGSPLGGILLGASAEDEVDVVWKGKSSTAFVSQIFKSSLSAQPSSLLTDIHDANVPDVELLSSNQNLGYELENFNSSPLLAPIDLSGVSTSRSRQSSDFVSNESFGFTPNDDTRPGQISDLNSIEEVSAATEDEESRYKNYKEKAEAAGIRPRPLPDWLEGVRNASRVIDAGNNEPR